LEWTKPSLEDELEVCCVYDQFQVQSALDQPEKTKLLDTHKDSRLKDNRTRANVDTGVADTDLACNRIWDSAELHKESFEIGATEHVFERTKITRKEHFHELGHIQLVQGASEDKHPEWQLRRIEVKRPLYRSLGIGA
jgi:hypothetical protein